MDKKIDARTLPLEAIEEKRRLTHQLRKRGLTRAEIGGLASVHADTVGSYLKRRGMTPQKRAYEQCDPEVRRWLKREYPAIQAHAKREDAEIYWGDETGLRNDRPHERGYAPTHGSKTIALGGLLANICIGSTMRTAYDMGFEVFTVTDCAATLGEEPQKTAIEIN